MNIDRIPDIRSRIGVADELARRGHHLASQSGSTLKYRCPLPGHDDNTPSFSVEGQGWRCWSACNKGGDVIDLVMALDGITKAEAIDRLASQIGMFPDPAPAPRPIPPKVTQTELSGLREYVDACKAKLRDHPQAQEARDYVLRRFRLKPEEAERLGLGVDGGASGVMRPRALAAVERSGSHLVIPFRDGAGQVNGVQLRSLTPDAEPRFRCPSGSGWAQWGCFEPEGAEPGDPVLVCESPTDALAAVASGFPVAFVRGASVKPPAEMVDYVRGRTNILAIDPDEAGEQWAASVRAMLPGEDVRRLVLTDGVKDVAELVERDGPEALAELDAEPMPEPELVPVSASARTDPLSPPPRGQRVSAKPVLAPAALHGLAGEVLRTFGPHSEADPAALLLTFLAAFGCSVGRGPHMLADGAEHPARLHTVLVGMTSKGRKGTSWAQIRRLMRVADPGRFVDDERVMSGFGSGEAVVDAVAGEHKELLVLEPEWARLLSVGKREGSTLSPLMRQAWDGDRLQVRSRNKTSVADQAHVSVLGHVTREELRLKLTDTEIANGFANRHLFGLVERSKLLPSGGHIPQEGIDALGERIRKTIEGARKIPRMHRTEAAEKRWTELYRAMADDEPEGLLGAVIGRDAAQVLRLSVVYALLDVTRQIDLPHLEAAWALWQYCRLSAEVIFGNASGHAVADKLLAAIVEAGPKGLTLTEQNKALGGHVASEELAAVRALLVRRGQVVELPRTDTGGRAALVTVASHVAEEAEKAEKGSAPPSPGGLIPHNPLIPHAVANGAAGPTAPSAAIPGPTVQLSTSDDPFTVVTIGGGEGSAACPDGLGVPV